MIKQGLIHVLTVPSLVILQEIQAETIELEPLFEPNPVGFTFDTPAWQVLGMCLLAGVIFIIFQQFKRYSKNKYRREAIKALGEVEAALGDSQLDLALNKVRIVLKQVAIFTFGRPKVAPLYGEDWIKFLESTGKNTSFSKYEGLLKSTVIETQETTNLRIKELITLSKKWIRTHAR
ncbi:MAG: hypothetical protein ACJA1P_002805 [Maribacter sp.]|jgi:hypothetical protein